MIIYLVLSGSIVGAIMCLAEAALRAMGLDK